MERAHLTFNMEWPCRILNQSHFCRLETWLKVTSLALIPLLPLTYFNTTQAADLTIGLMQSMHRIVVEMIPHRWAVNCSHIRSHLTIVKLFSRMVYIQILRPVATMVGTSSIMWTFNAIDAGYLPIGPESCGIIKPPNVVSISYGGDEVLSSPAYVKRQCWEYAKVRYVFDQLFLRLRDFAARDDGDICDLQ